MIGAKQYSSSGFDKTEYLNIAIFNNFKMAMQEFSITSKIH
jgi:hypothetical protein